MLLLTAGARFVIQEFVGNISLRSDLLWLKNKVLELIVLGKSKDQKRMFLSGQHLRSAIEQTVHKLLNYKTFTATLW